VNRVVGTHCCDCFLQYLRVEELPFCQYHRFTEATSEFSLSGRYCGFPSIPSSINNAAIEHSLEQRKQVRSILLPAWSLLSPKTNASGRMERMDYVRHFEMGLGADGPAGGATGGVNCRFSAGGWASISRVQPSASFSHRRNLLASVARGGGGDEDYRSGDSRSDERDGRQIRTR
jgi:hypothetical protein